MSAVAARKAALLLQQAAHALPFHAAPATAPRETTPQEVPKASSSRKTYAKKDNAAKSTKNQKSRNAKTTESSRSSRRQSPVQSPIEISDSEPQPEDRVFVEIDVVSNQSSQETDDESVQEIQIHQNAPVTSPRAPSNDGTDGSDFEFDFQESGILSGNGRPRKKRRIDEGGQVAVSSFVPVEGVNVHRLPADTIERILPNLPKRKAVVVVLHPEEVSLIASLRSSR